jgi:WD40 repeat protein
MGVVDDYGGVEVWDIASGRRIGDMPLPALGSGQVVTSDLAVYADDTNVNLYHPAVRVVDLSRKKERFVFPTAQSTDRIWTIEVRQPLAVSASGHLLAWVENETTNHGSMGPRQRFYRVTVADLRTGKMTAQVTVPILNGGREVMEPIAVSPDELKAAVGSCSGGHSVGVIDLRSQKLLWQKSVPGGVWAIAFHPDGGSFFTTDDVGQVRRYDTATG